MNTSEDRQASRTIRIEGSTLCQLRCPTCPTTEGKTHKGLGAGFLTSANFRRLVEQFPQGEVITFELANYGEVFLNPQIIDILKIAREYGFWVACYSGANMNTVKEDVLEAIVKHQMLGVMCSIDGASDETYEIYRRRGNFTQVIENIKKINHYKEIYNSTLPYLSWQFVAFGHNEHEIETARRMAHEMNMEFILKASWREDISPLKDPAKLEPVALPTTPEAPPPASVYVEDVCDQLWISPQINYDGRVLGCCANFWGDFGTGAFDNYAEAVNSEKMRYARAMLQGKVPSRSDIPCSNCDLYKARQAKSGWMDSRPDVVTWPPSSQARTVERAR